MTHQEKETLRLQIVAEAMSQLIPNQNFQQFIGVLREQREVVIEDLCRDDTVKDERATMALIGELRALKSIISVYDQYRKLEAI